MPAQNYYSLTVPPAGGIRFPSVQSANPDIPRMTITANSNNSGPISIQNGPPSLRPGATVTLSIETASDLMLSGLVGDGCGFVY